ncbi:MAG: hypothetical protein XE11_1777 [Methanomicrobiales archaeon 53_19]|jgi:hypothetical protein|uniref:hypothetical protein n=1 Tax=Methanocalculus sp. TaxID=2004547 RepID=UPI000746E19A|nr:hypothetical protein [Methanocalculus sp.]KUL02402.1 MAG: hypothetical protein XE11_1777 [Methanomicrobiales archaeon 53_19]HIJ05889.1 hypothetical protein [Methanocalculus sp.]
MNTNGKKIIIGIFIALIIIFAVYLIILLSQPNCFIYADITDKDQIDFGTDVIIHLSEEDFNKHPVLREIITGDKPLSRILIRDPRGVSCKEQKIIKEEYCQEDPFSSDYKKLVEWNGSYYELSCVIS